MTTNTETPGAENCPAEALLKLLSGRWKPQIFRLAVEGPVRFNGLLRQLLGSNKQSVAAALKELEAAGVLTKTVVKEKPLHIEYALSTQGRALVSVFATLESLA